MPRSSGTNPETTVTMLKTDHAKIKAYAKKHGITITEALGALIESREVKKMAMEEPKSKQIDLDICDACDAEVPSDAIFCPYCGMEFEEDEEDDEDDDEEED